MSLRYVCDGDGCVRFVDMTRRGVLPAGWEAERGWTPTDERSGRSVTRPVTHFCPACVKKRNDARIALGRKPLGPT